MTRIAILNRLMEILRRHVREEDGELADDGLVRAVFDRYVLERGWALVDPNE